MICPCCGKDITSVQREIKMELPEAVLAIPPHDRKKRVGVAGTAFIHIDARRFFVRALLPVFLSDGHEFHFGVWLETPEETSRKLWTSWENPQYSKTRFEATLANPVPPWNQAIMGSPCVAAVRDKDQLPYIESSTDPQLAAVLRTPWARAECEALVDKVWSHRTG